jgi:hypothetical protein
MTKFRLKPNMEEDLAVFVEGMRRKLYENRHKDTPGPKDRFRLLALLHKEIAELIIELEKTDDFDREALFLESCDVGNMAFLIYTAADVATEEREENKDAT